jgi:formylglycine-generating enzyme required for sulfatase activity
MTPKILAVTALLASCGSKESHQDVGAGSAGSAAGAQASDRNMVRVPAGSYKMRVLHYRNDNVCTPEMLGSGGVAVTQGWAQDSVATSDFEIDKVPVSAKNYCDCVDHHGCPSVTGLCPAVAAPTDDFLHYASVSAEAAAAYCTTRGLRLPTAEELQAALRGPDGNDTPKCEAVLGTSQRDCQFRGVNGTRAWNSDAEWTRSLECSWTNDPLHPAIERVALNSSLGAIGLPVGESDKHPHLFRCVRDSFEAPK